MDVLSNDPVDDTDARVVEVRIRLDKPSSERVAGMSYARVEVVILPSESKSESKPATGENGPPATQRATMLEQE